MPLMEKESMYYAAGLKTLWLSLDFDERVSSSIERKTQEPK